MSAMTLAPPYRGGAVALFDVQRVQRVLGKILVAGQDKPHVYGELTVTSANGRIVRISGRQRRLRSISKTCRPVRIRRS